MICNLKKKAFTVIEIVIVIFIIAIIVSISIPFSLTNIKQAKLISLWQRTLDEANYAYDVFNLQENSSFDQLHKFFEANYISSKSKPNLKNYKIKFLDNSNISKNSKYFIKDFYLLENGTILGYKIDNPYCKGEQICGIMIFDLNGEDQPNKFGKDVFGVEIYRKTLLPFGHNLPQAALKLDCSRQSSGVYCSEYFLYAGKLD